MGRGLESADGKPSAIPLKVGACITTRDEAGTIGPLVDSLRKQAFHVFVVDNASVDDTAHVARDHGAFVHELNSDFCRGIGPALMLAWNLALQAGCQYVLQIDAGGSHDPQDATRFIEALDRGAEMVIGSRFHEGALYIGNPKRRILSRVAAIMCRVAHSSGHWSDWTSGYRAFSADAIRQLLTKHYYQTMHPWQVEVLAQATDIGLNIVEVPITYRAGRSSLSLSIMFQAYNMWGDLFHHYGNFKRR